MSELSMMARDGTKTDADRALYNFEFNQLASYVTDAGSKDFNGVSLFSSTPIDVTTDADGNTFTMAGIDMTAGAYQAATSSSIDTIANASVALNNVKAAIDQLATDRASAGAYQTRLARSADQLTVVKENLSSASSRIRDVDVAEESTTYARFNILVQSGTAMLAQANQLPSSVLKLLQ
jgi:flagellin